MQKFFVFFILLSSVLLGTPPKAIVFDYGGVVARIDRRPVLEYISESLDKNYRKVKKDFASDELYKALQQPKSFWEEYAGRPLSDEWFAKLDSLKKMVIQETPGMSEILKKIKEQGIQVALLSNTNPHRARFIESMGGYDLFDPILLSCYLGAKKPQQQIYQQLLKSLAWEAKDCVFIDNRPDNVKGSRQCGMDGIIFISLDQLIEELKKRDVKIE